MDFKSKNFKYVAIKMDELIERVFEKTPSNYLLLKTKVSKISDAIYLAFISPFKLTVPVGILYLSLNKGYLYPGVYIFQNTMVRGGGEQGLAGAKKLQ